MSSPQNIAKPAEAYAVVGELVMMAAALDYQLNHVLIAVLHLSAAPMLEPVIATLDPTRKIEILKARARHMPAASWGKRVSSYCNKVERVSRQRNIACHTPPALVGNVWTFKPVAAAKLLKGIDLPTKQMRGTSLNDFRTAIQVGETALGLGEQIVENFAPLNT